MGHSVKHIITQMQFMSQLSDAHGVMIVFLVHHGMMDPKSDGSFSKVGAARICPCVNCCSEF